MSKPGLVVLLFFLSCRALSQDYFVFIGSDHRQPFYVRIDSQVYTSSAAGHLLLAPMKDSDYILTIGFPGQIYPERRYAVGIRGKDQEFGLQRQDDGSWRLYDEVGRHWVTAIEKESKPEPGLAGVKKDDAFSRMMAGVVHDTAVLYNTYAMEEALKDSGMAKGGADTSAMKPDGATKGGAADSPVVGKQAEANSFARPKDSPVRVQYPVNGTVVPMKAHVEPVRPDSGVARDVGAGVVKVSEKKSARSVRLVYADRTDTVVMIIPRDTVPKGGMDTARKKVIGMVRSKDGARKLIVDTANRVRSDTFRRVDSGRTKTVVDAAGKLPADTARKAPLDSAGRATKAIAYINSDCHNFATDNDVDRLRVKMLAAAKDEDKIAAARKVFRTRCFYTPQISALSELFASDAGKFRFFEAAWPFAADEHFGELSSLLTDPVYIGKFKTMVGVQP